jgi:hypothetical protein
LKHCSEYENPRNYYGSEAKVFEFPGHAGIVRYALEPGLKEKNETCQLNEDSNAIYKPGRKVAVIVLS